MNLRRRAKNQLPEIAVSRQKLAQFYRGQRKSGNAAMARLISRHIKRGALDVVSAMNDHIYGNTGASTKKWLDM